MPYLQPLTEASQCIHTDCRSQPSSSINPASSTASRCRRKAGSSTYRTKKTPFQVLPIHNPLFSILHSPSQTPYHPHPLQAQNVPQNRPNLHRPLQRIPAPVRQTALPPRLQPRKNQLHRPHALYPQDRPGSRDARLLLHAPANARYHIQRLDESEQEPRQYAG